MIVEPASNQVCILSSSKASILTPNRELAGHCETLAVPIFCSYSELYLEYEYGIWNREVNSITSLHDRWLLANRLGGADMAWHDKTYLCHMVTCVMRPKVPTNLSLLRGLWMAHRLPGERGMTRTSWYHRTRQNEFTALWQLNGNVICEFFLVRLPHAYSI